MNPDEIAESALSLWDMHAEDTGAEDQLHGLVANSLMGMGLNSEVAEKAAKMAGAAFNAVTKRASPKERLEFESDPIYVAMVNKLKSGEWDL